jgi:hypothetical protein
MHMRSKRLFACSCVRERERSHETQNIFMTQIVWSFTTTSESNSIEGHKSGQANH